MRRFIAASLTLATATLAVAGPTVQPLVIEGDTVSGVGETTLPASVAVNNFGQWYAEWDTNHADTNADSVLLSGFGVGPFAMTLREGQALPSPAGATLDSFDAININDSGNSGWNFFLDGTTGSNDDSGIYFNTNLLIQEGTNSTAPSMPSTPYIGFFDAKINNSNQILVTASVDIPGVGTTVDRALVRVDNPGGAFTETVIIKEGDEPVPGRFVTDLGTGPHETAFNNNGNVMYAVDIDGDSASNALIMVDNTVVAQEGDAAPVAGRTYSSLTSTELDLNNSGDFMFSASLDGDSSSNLLIVKNGAKFVQEGDVLADTNGFGLTSFGSGPIDIDDGGNILWYGDWSDPDTDIDTGLFLNDRLLVQEGVTTVNVNGSDMVIDTLNGISEAYAFSDNGQFVIFRAQLVGGIDGVFMLQIPEPTTGLLLAAGLLVALRRRP